MRFHFSSVASVFLAAVLTLTFSTAARATEPVKSNEQPKFKSEVAITVEDGVRTIRANGIPDHAVGAFPNRSNPNTISPQKYQFKMPTEPKLADKPLALRMQPFGIAVNGVVFDPGAAEWFNRDRNSGWQYEPLATNGFLGVDESRAHVQPNGAYHYHGIPKLLLEKLTEGKEKMTLVGWAADGFPIYNSLGHRDPKDDKSGLKTLKSSYQLKKGVRPDGPKGNYDGTFVADYEFVEGSGDLDACNGRSEPTAEFPSGTYRYCLTDEFPFIPRFYHGTPDASFERHPPAGGPGGRGGAGGPGGPPGRPGGPGGGPGGPPGFGPPPRPAAPNVQPQ